MYCNNVADMSEEEAATVVPNNCNIAKGGGTSFVRAFAAFNAHHVHLRAARLWLAGLSLSLSLVVVVVLHVDRFVSYKMTIPCLLMKPAVVRPNTKKRGLPTSVGRLGTKKNVGDTY